MIKMMIGYQVENWVMMSRKEYLVTMSFRGESLIMTSNLQEEMMKKKKWEYQKES